MPTRVFKVTSPKGEVTRYHGHHVFMDIQEHFLGLISDKYHDRILEANIQIYGYGDGRDISEELLQESIRRFISMCEACFAENGTVPAIPKFEICELEPISDKEISFENGSSETWQDGKLVNIQFPKEGHVSLSGCLSRENVLGDERSYFRRHGWERADVRLKDAPPDAASIDVSQFITHYMR